MKTRVLWVGEATFLNTGYSVYGREVLSRLYQQPDLEIAELAGYGQANDPRMKTIPWKVYPNLPSNDGEKRVYDSSGINQFGAWKFEQIIVDFKPHVVMDIRDVFMFDFQDRSPARSYFHTIYMPTVDASPQNEQWLDIISRAEGVFTYQDWSYNVLLKETGGRAKLLGSASPAASEEFKPLNKEKCKSHLGLEGKTVIGTVMRNQRRKLYPELFKVFSRYLKDTGRDDVVLYCHTSYPDMGWDFARLLNDSGISSKVLFTYICRACNAVFPSKFQDGKTICHHCNKNAAEPSSVQVGLDNKTFANIYNAFDLYVQYSNCLPAGQQVLLKSGWTNIENVKIGDYAFSHTGKYKKVINTFKHKHNQNILKFNIHSDYEILKVTPEHPLYVVTAENSEYKSTKMSFREWLGVRIKNGKSIPEPQFVDAYKVKPGDLLVYTIDQTIKDIQKIDLLSLYKDTENYIIDDNSYRHKGSTVSHNRFIDINNEFCKWLGLYVADGNSNINNSAGSLRVTSHEKETNNHDLCYNIMSKYGNVKTYNYPDKHAISQDISNKIFSKVMSFWCCKGENKKLPNWCLQLPLNKIKSILIGLFMGDGHYIKKANTSVYCTISKSLAEQIKHLFRRVGVTYNVLIRQKKGNRQPQYTFEVRGNIKNGEFNISRSSTRSLNDGKYYYYQVKSKTEEEFNDYVYNFEVKDDNSYLSKICVVHNSEGLGMPQLEAAACGIPIISTDYSAMEDVVPKLGGILIPLTKKYVEIETGCERAIPDDYALLNILKEQMSRPKEELLEWGNQTRQNYLHHYSWDKTAEKWYNAIKLCNTEHYDNKWKTPPQIINPPQPNYNLSNSEFAKFLIVSVLGEPTRLFTLMHARLERDLNLGYAKEFNQGMYYDESSALFSKPKFGAFNKEIAYKHFCELRGRINQWEKYRVDNC